MDAKKLIMWILGACMVTLIALGFAGVVAIFLGVKAAF